MKISYSYDTKKSSIFGQIRRPIAIISFWSKKYKRFIKYPMIVDTGADYTLLPFSKLRDLGFDLEKDCQKYMSYGIGGPETVYFLKRKVKIKIGNREQRIPVGFLVHDEIPALLGRHECLDCFDVLFSHFTTTFSSSV